MSTATNAKNSKEDEKGTGLLVFISSLKMAMATFISRILGLVREQVMAYYFGASSLTDAFLVAYRIPNLLRDLFAEGAFSAAFVPAFIEENQHSKEKARVLLWSLFVMLLMVTGLLVTIIILGAPYIVSFFAPSFEEVPRKFAMTVTMVRVMAPFLSLVSLAALFMGALNSLKVFFIPSLAPAMFNIMMISSMVFGYKFFETKGLPPIYALALGVLLGGLAQGLIQFPLILKKGYGPQALFQFDHPKIKEVFKKLGPGLVGFAATQINLIVNTILASSAAIGAVSWLSYAFRLFQFPVGILGVSVAGSNLVHFSQEWKKGNRERALQFLQTSFFFNYLFMVPSTLFLIFAGKQIVRLIFERGQFSIGDTESTTLALWSYSYGLFFYGLYKVLVPVFYTIDRQKIPVIISVISIAFNIVFCISLVPHYGFSVLALGTSLSMMINSIAQLVILKKELQFSWELFFNLRHFKIVLAAALSLVASAFILQHVFLSTILMFAAKALCMGILYAGFLLVMGEGQVLRSAVRKK